MNDASCINQLQLETFIELFYRAAAEQTCERESRITQPVSTKTLQWD